MKTDQILAAVQTQKPLVHCITNYVAMNIAANVVLAAGASPAMVHAEAEVADFVPISGALTINIGTLSPGWVSAMHKAADAANASGKPWVLDPVAHFATPYRDEVVRDLIARGPTIIRGNASEIMALLGAATAGKGVDSGDSVADAEGAATALAKAHDCVVVVTGEQDFVTDGNRAARVSGGSDIMPMITAMGCSLTALMGAFAAVSPPFEASVAALAMFAEAGTRAARTASGPGSFQVAFLDALSQIKPEDLASDANVQWL
ncbi:hydroxyethylthiazole kinase [Hoeflea sp. AS16]|uniref:hydroxyethylthiazole kinase n=1 Tax=Hoeflea sp. AS16 TaxID=3135779 RepID=UPI00316F7EF7